MSSRPLLRRVSYAVPSSGETRSFVDTRIRIDPPIEFYRNGTTTGGVINLRIGDYVFILHIKAPLGDMNLESGAQAT